MDRRIAFTGVLLAGLLAAMPALAQQLVLEEHIWTTERPDGHAPAGMKSDFLLPKGRIYVGYRHSVESFADTLIGTAPITSADVLDVFAVAPLTHDRLTGEFDVRFGVTDWATAEVSVPWTRNEMLNTTALGFYETRSQFLGDLAFQGLFDLLEMDEYRLTGTVGATVPLGTLGKRGVTSTGAQGVLPFTMQGGSGSWDVLVGGTFQAQNEVSSIGAQITTVTRIHTNTKGYRLGDEFTFSLWGAYNISDWISFSIRALFEHQGDIFGFESRTDGTANPLANPFAQGGDRVLIPFGINLYLREGLAAGHRLSLEVYYPVHEDLNGPQMSVDQTLVASWRAVF